MLLITSNQVSTDFSLSLPNEPSTLEAMVEKRQELPVGIQDFVELRHCNAHYVDKTACISRLIQEVKYGFLSRPRRFGKSMLLSTIAAYFEGRKELFEGLYLENAELELAQQQGREAWGQHPVFYLDFTTGNYTQPDEIFTQLHFIFSKYEKHLGITIEPAYERGLGARFERLICTAYEQTGKQVIVLVDEYDKPLLHNFNKAAAAQQHEANLNTLASVFSVLKSCDRYLRFGFIVGVTRFARVSIFSSVNNLLDLSMMDNYAGLCGITEQELRANFMPEIEELARANALSVAETFAQLKKDYDGYRFSKNGENVYNPFSLLNVLKNKDFGRYWFTAGTGNYLASFLEEASLDVPSLDGGIEYSAQELEHYKAVREDAIPILFQAGYLTIQEYIPDEKLYRLRFPNDEVRYAFLSILFPSIFPANRTNTSRVIIQFKRAVVAGDVDGFMEQIRTLIAGCPYGNDRTATEDHYQTAVYLIFKLMGEFVLTEVHSAKGRADCIVFTDKNIYIFEFKLWSTGTPEEAIAQIKAQGYATPYLTDGREVVLVGASFDEEQRTLGAWKVERL